MGMSQEEIRTVNEAIYLVYAELWAHHRALIAVVSERCELNPDHLETDVETYHTQHLDELIDEGRRRLGDVWEIAAADDLISHS